MLFDELQSLLDAELKAVFPAFLTLAERGPVSGFAEMIETEPKARSPVDQAVTHWADHRRWPLMEPALVPHVVARLNSALRFLSCASQIQLEASTPESHVLAWLLVDYWRAAGRSRWLHALTCPQDVETEP